jgi:hypothetical protein
MQSLLSATHFFAGEKVSRNDKAQAKDWIATRHDFFHILRAFVRDDEFWFRKKPAFAPFAKNIRRKSDFLSCCFFTLRKYFQAKRYRPARRKRDKSNNQSHEISSSDFDAIKAGRF